MFRKLEFTDFKLAQDLPAVLDRQDETIRIVGWCRLAVPGRYPRQMAGKNSGSKKHRKNFNDFFDNFFLFSGCCENFKQLQGHGILGRLLLHILQQAALISALYGYLAFENDIVEQQVQQAQTNGRDMTGPVHKR